MRPVAQHSQDYGVGCGGGGRRAGEEEETEEGVDGLDGGFGHFGCFERDAMEGAVEDRRKGMEEEFYLLTLKGKGFVLTI
mmetsp:Transcript_14022/g.25672  ORF Transcript_14022/g.25672 Transcript_14022/m.25672 type:complete len:80 (-) Transcript_14022:73-312(-)